MKSSNRIPSLAECYNLINRYKMLLNIIEHSEQVMRVSLAIIENLKERIKLNKDLVIASSLLHDITKTRALSTKEKHDISGGELLRELGFRDVARIVEEHVFLKNFISDGILEEKEIVYYADKRVMHSKIVTIEDRISDIISRYGNTPKKIRMIQKNKDLVIAVEKKINSFMIRDINEIISGIS